MIQFFPVDFRITVLRELPDGNDKKKIRKIYTRHNLNVWYKNDILVLSDFHYIMKLIS